MSTDVRILQPGTLEPPLGEIRFLFLPPKDLFEHRAGRLRHLAGKHSLGDYLHFLALLAEAQQDALNTFPALSSPAYDEQARGRELGKPLLDARSLPRDPAWQEGLEMILQEMQEASLPPAAHEAITGIMQASEAELEKKADRILARDMTAVSPRELPFISAALQVYWTRMASWMKEAAFGRRQNSGLCPVCGSHPVAGVVKSGREQGLRYLTCSLCSSEWHKVRLTCSNCEATAGLDYFTPEGSNGAVKAESCSTCNSYLKLLYLGKDPHMEATADDLATLNLDMLMNGEGKARGGPNLYFHPGMPH